MPRFRDAKRKKKNMCGGWNYRGVGFLIITAVDKANNYLR